MKKLIYQLEQYLRETLGITAAPHPWEISSGLPQYLRERYHFLKIDILGIEYVLMADTGEGEQPPAIIGKHLDQISARNNAKVVYVRHAVTSYNRKRLIEQKIPFIVPGNQMYLPMLGIDLREHMKRLREKKLVFSPSTQALILHVLWRKKIGPLAPAEIARRLGYSAMTMTRAFNELEAAGIGEHSVMGKERHVHFPETGKPLWEKALPYLTTPVRKHLYGASPMHAQKGNLAGLSALASYTMLAEPKIPVYAIPVREWKVWLQQRVIFELISPEPGSFEIELWKYAPAQFANKERVDRLSLYLSLRDSANERIQSALDALLGGMEW